MWILMCKVKRNLFPRTNCDKFYTNSHAYSLRQRDFNYLDLTLLHMEYLGPRVWSKLTNKERSAINLKQFFSSL